MSKNLNIVAAHVVWRPQYKRKRWCWPLVQLGLQLYPDYPRGIHSCLRLYFVLCDPICRGWDVQSERNGSLRAEMKWGHMRWDGMRWDEWHERSFGHNHHRTSSVGILLSATWLILHPGTATHHRQATRAHHMYCSDHGRDSGNVAIWYFGLFLFYVCTIASFTAITL